MTSKAPIYLSSLEEKPLIETGLFTLHSGQISNWRVNLDSLDDETIEALARIVSTKLHFSHVHGIPEGGLRFAEHLKKYSKPNSKNLLIVDDVCTTGASFEAVKHFYLKEVSLPYPCRKIIGLCILERGKKPKWVTSLFKANFDF